MPAQALYRKWRPQLWDEVIGQEAVVQTLRNAISHDHVAHAYLFSGPRGCGKTTSARLVAKALNCLNPDPARRPDGTCDHCTATAEGRFLDLIEIDGASNNGVEDIRELRERVGFAPSLGRYKIYIIDEVHMLSTGAFNALLKTLEEPPPHTVFILATTESNKIPATITSRCQRFAFRRIPLDDIIRQLKAICGQEGFQAEDAALELVARQATGAMRDALSLLDQLAGNEQVITLAAVQNLLGSGGSEHVQQLVDALIHRDLAGGLTLVNRAIDAGADPRQLARQTVDYFRSLLLVREGNVALVDAPAGARTVMAEQAKGLSKAFILQAIDAINAAANDARGGWQPQLPLELAVVRCTDEPAAVPALAPAAVVTASPALTMAPMWPGVTAAPVAAPPVDRTPAARPASAPTAAAPQRAAATSAAPAPRAAPTRPAASSPAAPPARPAPVRAAPVAAATVPQAAPVADNGPEFWAGICRELGAVLVG